MWDFFETVHHRHSIRKYHPDMPVEQEKLHAVLATACAAPSAGDLQPYRIIAVRDPELRRALQQAARNQDFIVEAPVCLVFCCDRPRSAEQFGDRGRELYAIQDTTIAAAYAQLAVVAAGMGSTWVGHFDEEEAARVLDLDPSLEPVAMLSVGYPAELPEPTSRRRLEDVIEYR